MKNLFIVWSEVHMTKITVIDEQHRGIVSIINNLFYFMGEQRAVEFIHPALIMLEQSTKVHFMTEELLLELTHYEKTEEHKVLHKKLLTNMTSVAIKSRWTKDPNELLSFLKEWWLTHINGIDHEYAPFVFRRLRELGKL